DTVDCEGRSLLKTFVAASVRRGESVHVFGFEIPEEEFRAGFDPDVAAQLLYQDGFTDPLCWNGKTGGFRVEEFSVLGVVTRLQRGPVGSATIILDSLSWLLLHRPVPALCQTLAQIPRAAANAGLDFCLRVTRIVVLLHGDLHPLGLVDTLHSLARAVVWVGPAPEGMRSKEDAHQLASMLQRKGSGQEEYFSILTGFTLKAFGEPTRNTPPADDICSPQVDTAAYLTFNLQLSDTERQARDRVPLPFHFSAQKKSSLLEASAGTGKIYYEPDATDDLDEEDPDDDLDV
uniref:Elongator complex protein 5 n=1 Tax=Pelodiscus sinensis TaxID=13735 RepID=K7FYW3_PELSI